MRRPAVIALLVTCSCAIAPRSPPSSAQLAASPSLSIQSKGQLVYSTDTIGYASGLPLESSPLYFFGYGEFNATADRYCSLIRRGPENGGIPSLLTSNHCPFELAIGEPLCFDNLTLSDGHDTIVINGCASLTVAEDVTGLLSGCPGVRI